MAVEVQVFGHLRASSSGEEAELGGTKQQRVLLALVLANGTVVSTDDLIDLVWGDAPPSKPNVTLRSYVSHLRRALEPGSGRGSRRQVLLTRSPGYAVDPEQLRVDIHEFAATARTAIAHATNDAPAAVLAATSEAFNHWPEHGAMPIDTALRPLADFPGEVSKLTELHLALSAVHYRAALAAGRATEALDTLESASAAHPSSEELIALRMEALYRVGRQTDALHVFKEARNRLIEDHGLEPSPILTELERRILDNDPALLEIHTPVSSRPATTGTASPVAPVGRAGSFDRLLHALPGPDRSEPGGAIIGPPGIGKSTLLHALADVATQRSIATVWGRCSDSGSAATLRPWKSVLRDLLERTDPERVADVFGPQGGELLRVVPELGSLIDVTPPASDNNDISDAITRTLCRWADSRPLVICLEDLQWADTESLVVIKHVLDALTHASDGGSMAEQPVSFLLTWRDTDVAVEAVDSRQPRTQHLADIGRAVGSCRISLEGLTEADVTEIVRKVARVDPDPADVQRLTVHTGGNPLFVTELLREGRGQSFAATDTIRDVVLRRLDTLPDSAFDVMTAAALCHPAIDEAILPELTGRTDDELSDHLERAMAAKLIEESPSHDGLYRFTHDLLAETLTAELRQRTRAELHAKVGDLLEKRRAPVADIAHHYLLGATAGVSLAAARFALAASVEAEELGDFTGAVRWIDDGLAALDLGPDAPTLRIDMLIDKAQALKFLSKHVESQEASSTAFDLAVEAGETDLAIVAAMCYVGRSRIDQTRRNPEWLGYWSPPDESVAILERSLELLPDDHQWRSVVTLALSNQMFAAHHDQDRADELARVGLARMRDEGDPAAFAEGNVSMAAAHARTFPLSEREAMLAEAIDIARSLDDPKIELRARKGLIGTALDRRDLATAQAQVDLAEQVAARYDDPFAAMQATTIRVSLDLLAGDHAAALERIQTAFAEHRNLGTAATDTLGMQFFTLARHAGNFDAIIAGLEGKLEGYDGPAYGGPLAAVQARAGYLDDALATIARFTESQITWAGEGILQFMTPAYFADAVADLSIERPQILHLARPLLEALEPAANRLLCLVGGADYPGTGSLHSGRLLTALGDTDAAAEMLGRAVDHLTAIDAASSLLYTHLAIAENHAAQGDDGAEARLDELATEAERMGMKWTIEWQRTRIQQRLHAAGV